MKITSLLFLASVAALMVSCSGAGFGGKACISTIIAGVPVEICTGNGEPVPVELLQEVERLQDK